MAPSPWDHGPQFLIFTNEHRKAMCPKNQAMFSQLAKPSYWKLLSIARCNPHCLSLSKPKRAQRQSRDEGYHAGAKSPKVWSTRTLLKCGANADGDLKILVNDSSMSKHEQPSLSPRIIIRSDCANMLEEWGCPDSTDALLNFEDIGKVTEQWRKHGKRLELKVPVTCHSFAADETQAGHIDFIVFGGIQFLVVLDEA